VQCTVFCIIAANDRFLFEFLSLRDFFSGLSQNNKAKILTPPKSTEKKLNQRANKKNKNKKERKNLRFSRKHHGFIKSYIRKSLEIWTEREGFHYHSSPASFFIFYFFLNLPCTVLYYCSFCRVILLNASSSFNLSTKIYTIYFSYKQFTKKFSFITFSFIFWKIQKGCFQRKIIFLRRLFFFNSIFYFCPPSHSPCHTPTNQRAPSPPFPTYNNHPHNHSVRCLLAHFDISSAFRPSRCYRQHHGPLAFFFSTTTP
jgi:hypothetical protein